MTIIAAFILIILTAILLIPMVSVPWKGMIAVAAVLLVAAVTSVVAFEALNGSNYERIYEGSLVTGKIALKMDALSAWFILVINFTCITGAFYGLHYMKAYQTQKNNLTLHCTSFILVQASLISICVLQNMIAFLIGWEIMALSSFVLVIFEHQKRETLKAGINYLIQSHIGIMFFTLGFIWVSIRTNSFDFSAITLFSSTQSATIGSVLFLFFFTGFAIKAGFVPFHTWLPYAHPAAPSHVSGVMSGVIIKIGIYGMLRMLLLIKVDYLTIGYFIFFLSVFSGVYGVMLAIIQHNLKRLLAYHSIENIGIIGMGIGLGCIGVGKENHFLILLGFSGALLHTLNHSLFKSLLFYSAGNVYQSAHTLDIEKLGGIGKQMPHTAWLFLVAALAICGLPPFNGFVSEFIIYKGMFAGLLEADKTLLSSVVVGLFALALIGGLAILCFTKAFGAVFLGTPRHVFKLIPAEAALGKLLPMYGVVLLIVAIGLFPTIFINALAKPVELFAANIHFTTQPSMQAVASSLSMIGIWAIFFILLIALVYLIRWRVTESKTRSYSTTWGCGYIGPTGKMQYTASSFIRAYRKLAEPMLLIHKNKKEIQSIFPVSGGQETHPYDLAEKWLIDYPINRIKTFLNSFVFLQNGNLQFYILYGVSFITLVLIIPLLFNYLLLFINFLKTV
jgi:formate hydrogenlyase subunit 3/multisubunit Na+/H+ antiporter MnhD subunit